MSDQDIPRLFSDTDLRLTSSHPGFSPARLTQARRLAGMSKKAVAEAVGVSAVAVGQWESGAHPPRADHIRAMSRLFELPVAHFGGGRPHAQLETSAAHFRSLRKTPAKERERALAFVEQIWELTHALERHVELPPVRLPGFSAGEMDANAMPSEPVRAARDLRRQWGLGTGRIPRMVRLLEKHGIVVTLVPFAGRETATVDAFSTSRLPRPVVVLTPDRADDVYRHRFTAAHELGHLILHADIQPGDPEKEKEADKFAAEFLTPGNEITPLLPQRMDLKTLARIGAEWGVSASSLVYRSREVGIISEPSYRRAFQRLNQLTNLGLFQPQPVADYPGEMPAMLRGAYDLAEAQGLTVPDLATELCVTPERVRTLLGMELDRPKLRIL